MVHDDDKVSESILIPKNILNLLLEKIVFLLKMFFWNVVKLRYFCLNEKNSIVLKTVP